MIVNVMMTVHVKIIGGGGGIDVGLTIAAREAAKALTRMIHAVVTSSNGG